MKQRTPVFVLDCDDRNSNWSVQIYETTGGMITLGMFWGDKDTPTHEFSSKKGAFRKMIDTLAPRKDKK